MAHCPILLKQKDRSKFMGCNWAHPSKPPRGALYCRSGLIWAFVACQARCGIAWHGMEQHGIAQHGMAQHGMALHGMAQHGMAQRGMAQHGMAQHGMAQYGMQQHGMEQHSMAQHGMEQHDTACTAQVAGCRM